MGKSRKGSREEPCGSAGKCLNVTLATPATAGERSKLTWVCKKPRTYTSWPSPAYKGEGGAAFPYSYSHCL